MGNKRSLVYAEFCVEIKNMNEKNIRVLLFEDNKHYRESLFYIINGTPGYECVAAFPDCNDLMFRIKQNRPDVVLMDIEMPGITGIEAVKKIKAEYPDMQVLMQTVFNDDDHIFDAICAGASGYILKTTSPSEMLDAIKDVHHGGSPMSSGVARRVLNKFQKIVPKKEDKTDYQLTPREKEILALLVEGKSYKMIGADLGIGFETVRTHMKNIYSKLHVESLTEMVAKAVRERMV